jgi:hypothetical protein
MKSCICRTVGHNAGIMKIKILFKPYQPNQLLLLPPDMNQWLPEDDLAYFIMDVVNELDPSSTVGSFFKAKITVFRLLLKIWGDELSKCSAIKLFCGQLFLDSRYF